VFAAQVGGFDAGLFTLMGRGLFAAPAMIAGIVLRPQVAMSPGPGAIVTVLVLHMLLPMCSECSSPCWWPARASTVGRGLVYGIALSIMNLYVLSFVSAGARAMAGHEPVALAIGTHLIFGLVLGTVVARIGKSLPAAA